MIGIRSPHQSTRGPAFPEGAPQVHFSDGPKLIGKTITLTSGALVAGIATPGALFTPNLPMGTLEDTVGPIGPDGRRRLTNFNIEGQILSYKGPAAHYVISTQGRIQQPGSVTPNVTYPLACFVINWTIGGTNFETRVDGNSDQFLGIVAEQITVTGKWDEENGAINNFLALQYPAAMNMAASLSLGDGIPSRAFRTRLLPAPDPLVIPPQFVVPIPYAAKGYIVRSYDGAWHGLTNFFNIPTSAIAVDRYTAAQVAAAHGRGEYLSVPSTADYLAQSAAAPVGAFIGSVEFEMYM